MTPEEVSKRFNISLAAAIIRVNELARLKRAQTGEQRPLPKGVLNFLKEQKRKEFDVKSVDLDD